MGGPLHEAIASRLMHMLYKYVQQGQTSKSNRSRIRFLQFSNNSWRSNDARHLCVSGPTHGQIINPVAMPICRCLIKSAGQVMLSAMQDEQTGS